MVHQEDGAPKQSAVAGNTFRIGVICGFASYLLWGFFPLYWNLLDEANPFEIIAHRIIWCFVLTLIICLVGRLGLRDLLRQPRAWRFLAPAAVIVTVNWSIYIYAIAINHVVETAIGYYINPLLSILLGILVFRERLSVAGIVAVALCVFGVVFFTVNYGQFPWISIALAVSFAVYGALKKKAGYQAVPALAFEGVVMVVPAIVFAVVLAGVTGTHVFMGDTESVHGWVLTLLMIGGGVVTGVPLLLFSKAANSIPLSMLGFIQYLSPTIGLLLGVFLFGEAFTVAHAVCLGCIWLGIALVCIDTVRHR